MLAPPDPGTTRLALRQRQRLATLLARAERDGARWQFWATSASLLMVAILFASLSKWNAAFGYTLATLLFFFVTNLVNYVLVLRGIRPVWLGFCIGTLNVVFLTFIIISPNPFAEYTLPPAMGLREAGFKYLLIFVCLSALTLSPRLATWVGVTAAVSWGAAVAWVAVQPGTLYFTGSAETLTLGEKLRLYFNPNFVDLVDQATNIVVILIIAGIIASVVARTRNLAEDYTKAERARANLARHFSPNMVDEIALNDEPFGPVRRQDVAVLFADIVGFTNFSEDHPAEVVFQMLREFHRRMEQVVFDHGGTVDNYIGDCIMATFGVPRSEQDDPTRALRCARAMEASIAAWNEQRRKSGVAAVDVCIGCHFGPVVLGAIGSERNLSFAVVGDTCNVASRLQTMCRELDAVLCIGATVVDRIDALAEAEAMTGMVYVGPVHVRGRDGLVNVWILPKPEGLVRAPPDYQSAQNV